MSLQKLLRSMFLLESRKLESKREIAFDQSEIEREIKRHEVEIFAGFERVVQLKELYRQLCGRRGTPDHCLDRIQDQIPEEQKAIAAKQERIASLTAQLGRLRCRHQFLADHRERHEAEPLQPKSAAELMRQAEQLAASQEIVAALQTFDLALEVTREQAGEIARKREYLSQQLPLR